MSGARATGRLSLFLRAAVFDFLLVLAVSTALAFTVSYGFNSAPDLRGNALFIGGVCAPLLVILFAGSWSKRAAVLAAVAYIAAAVGMVLVVGGLGENVPLFMNGGVNDVAGNYAVFGFILVVVPAVVFLLSRRASGLAVLFVAAALACALIQFLYRDWISEQPGLLAALAVYWGCGALFVYQRYRLSVYRSQAVRQPQFGRVFGLGLAISGACLVVGLVLYFGIVASLGLSTPDIKPFQDYYQRPVVEYTGVYFEQQIDDPDNQTDELSDDQTDTSEQADGGTNPNDSTGTGLTIPVAVSHTLAAFDPDNWDEDYRQIAYEVVRAVSISLAVLLVIGLVVAIVLRLRLRERRLDRWRDLPASRQVALIYEFLVERFARLGIRKRPSMTPLEFALASSAEMARFKTPDCPGDFLQLTLAYQRAAYAGGIATDEDLQLAKALYRDFYRTARAQVGLPRWIWMFWRL